MEYGDLLRRNFTAIQRISVEESGLQEIEFSFDFWNFGEALVRSWKRVVKVLKLKQESDLASFKAIPQSSNYFPRC